MRTYILIICFITSVCFDAKGQYIPPNRSDLRLVNNISKLIQEAMPWIQEENAKRNAINNIESNNDRIKELLKWSPNSGFLIRIRVEKHKASGQTSSLPAEFLGMSDKPINALTEHFAKPYTISRSLSDSPMMIFDLSLIHI